MILQGRRLCTNESQNWKLAEKIVLDEITCEWYKWNDNIVQTQALK